jgi:recombination protein RecT
MSAEPVTTAVVKVDNTPGAMVRQHAESFTAVLPSHIKPDTWVRLAQSALKRGKKVKTPGGQVCTELELAAGNNPTMFLEPGTPEEYYLTPRKTKNGPEVLGITGYQGEIEMIYRAGAVSSVIVEVVREKDTSPTRPAATSARCTRSTGISTTAGRCASPTPTRS